MKRILFLCLFSIAIQSNAQRSDFGGIDFHKADSMALECKNLGLQNLPELAQQLTSNLETDVEKFRAIYKWVCSNIANDYSMYSKNMRKRRRFKSDTLKLQAWNEEFRQISFRKMLKQQKTICTGYAYLVKKLSESANINCETVHGFARTSTINIETLDVPNHSWNVVQLNGKWYLCDPTWASGIPNPTTSQFEFSYNDGFFLTNPKLFATNHFPVEAKWMLIDNSIPTFENFLEAPIIYGKAYDHTIINVLPKTLHNFIRKNDIVSFKYELQKTIKPETINFLIDNGIDSKKNLPKSITIKDEFLIVDYKFETTGFFDVHLYIGTDLIYTYTFDVKK
ncbi:MAG: transglutaminase domain-containing protein [Aquaticitalea sp.]